MSNSERRSTGSDMAGAFMGGALAITLGTFGLSVLMDIGNHTSEVIDCTYGANKVGVNLSLPDGNAFHFEKLNPELPIILLSQGDGKYELTQRPNSNIPIELESGEKIIAEKLNISTKSNISFQSNAIDLAITNNSGNSHATEIEIFASCTTPR